MDAGDKSGTKNSLYLYTHKKNPLSNRKQLDILKYRVNKEGRKKKKGKVTVQDLAALTEAGSCSNL